MKINHYLMGLLLVCGTFTLAFLVSASHAAVNLDNAFAIWLFDDENDTVVDHSPQGNDAKLTGGKWVAGKFGGGLQLGQGATLMSATANGVGNEVVSQTLWIKHDDFGAESQFGFIHASGTPNARFFYFSNWINGGPPHDGVHMGVLDGGGNWGRGMAIPKQFDEDEWYHLVGVADAAGGSLKVYINAKLVNNTPIAVGEIPGTPDQIWAGSGPEGKPTLGTIDEVAFFSVVLTPEDIEDIMNQGLSNSAAVESNGKLSITWADLKR